MKVVILRIADSVELSLVQDDKLVFTRTVGCEDNSNILNDCYTQLIHFKVDEMRLIISPIVKDSIDKSDIKLDSFNYKGRNKYCVMSKSDLIKIRDLCKQLDIPQLKVYNEFSTFKEFGKEEPVIVISKYLRTNYGYIYVNENGIIDFRFSADMKVGILSSMMSDYGTTNTVPQYNNLLSDKLESKITNLSLIESKEEKAVLSLSLVPLILSHSFSVNLMTDKLSIQYPKGDKLKENKPVEESTCLDDNLPTSVQDKKPLEKVNIFGKKASKKKLPFLVLDFVGIIVAIFVAICLIGNKELPKDIDYLSDRASEIKQMVAPRQDTVNYFNKYISSVKAGENIDSKLLREINAIEVDGLLAEVKLDKNKIGIVVFLKDESTINSYIASLNKLFKVSEHSNEGTVSLENTTLTKFIINGTI